MLQNININFQANLERFYIEIDGATDFDSYFTRHE